MITTTTTLKMAIAIRLISLKEVEFCSGVRPEQKDIVNVPSDNEKSGAGKNKTKHNCLVFPTHLCPLDSVHIKCRKASPQNVWDHFVLQLRQAPGPQFSTVVHCSYTPPQKSKQYSTVTQ